MFGIDVAKDRIDEQDRQIIAAAIKTDWKYKHALIIGSGKGRIGVMLAMLGFEVVCMDIQDFSDYYQKINDSLGLKKPITFIKKDLELLRKEDLPSGFTMVIAQRVLHYIPYKAARDVLDIIHTRMRPGAHLYVAFSSVDSSMGIGYQADPDITKRFTTLSESKQEEFNLTVPVCLYFKPEVRNILRLTRFKKDKFYQTNFGNIKANYRK